MRQYELTYLISDNVLESEINKVTGKVGGFLGEYGGKILKEEIWGRRKLAYPIKKQNFATYITMNIELPKEKVKEFEHEVRVTENIIRQILLVKDLGQEKIELTREDIAEAKDIEEVIGSEKSFEVVEGETDESRNLMQKRDKEGVTDKNDEKTTVASPEKKMEIEAELPSIEEKVIPKREKRSAKKGDAKSDKEKVATVKADEEKEIEAKEASKKPAKKVKKEKTSQEAERLSKLDKELEDILGETL